MSVESSYSHHPIDIPSTYRTNTGKKATAPTRVLHSAIHSLKHTKRETKAHQIIKKHPQITQDEIKLNKILSKNMEVHHNNVDLIYSCLDKMRSLSILFKDSLNDQFTFDEYYQTKNQCTNCFYNIVVSDGEAINDLSLLKDQDYHNKEINDALLRLTNHFNDIVSLYANILKMEI